MKIVDGYVLAKKAGDVNLTEWKKRWPSFSPSEFDCKHCGELKISAAFLDKLQAIRNRIGRPMPISSGYRCPEHNAKVSSTGRNGPHTTGHAADSPCYHGEAFSLVGLAMEEGMTGIGIRQAGALGSRFIHLDDLTSAQLGGRAPRPTIWEY